jgi:ABC-type transport system substrate-binding protein
VVATDRHRNGRSAVSIVVAVWAVYDRTYDDGTRAKLLDRAAHILEADVPVIVTVGREDLFGVSNAVKNFHPHAAAPFDDMLKVDVVP